MFTADTQDEERAELRKLPWDQKEMHWESMTPEQLQEVHDACTGQINRDIQDWKKCGAMKNAKDISDGYHTFGELYEVRAVLNIALFKMYKDFHGLMENEFGSDPKDPDLLVWRSLSHSDGSMFEGMFILGLGTEPGKQITFHYHLDKWDACDFAETLEKAPEWDGHTPADVLERLKAL